MGYNKERYPRLKNIAYHILFVVWYVVSCLPLWILYRISDILFIILCYVVRYRRKVVHENIKSSYPNLSSGQRWLIERRFYLHFCDLFVETIKYFSISEKEIRKRMRFKGADLVEQSAENGKTCGIFLGHYANWEWTASMPLWVNPEKCLCAQLYHPMENLVTDRLIGHLRHRWGGANINAEHSIRELVRYRQQGKPLVIGFVADQAPVYDNIHYWTNFLNHPDTPVFTGGEKIMQKFNMDVYYLDIRRIKRGYYEAEYKLITTEPQKYKEFELTEIYTRMMEETINRDPSYWLWSHKRWKRTKEGYLEKYQGRRTL